jgi:hypothetical protein
VAVSIVRVGKQLLDIDNLYAGCTPLINGLRDAGFILDDSPAHIQLSVKQEKTLENPHTKVTCRVLVKGEASHE